MNFLRIKTWHTWLMCINRIDEKWELRRLGKTLNFENIKIKMLLGFSIIFVFAVLWSIINYSVLRNINVTTIDVLDKELWILGIIIERASNARGYVTAGNQWFKNQFNKAIEVAEHYQNVILDLVSVQKSMIFYWKIL